MLRWLRCPCLYPPPPLFAVDDHLIYSTGHSVRVCGALFMAEKARLFGDLTSLCVVTESLNLRKHNFLSKMFSVFTKSCGTANAIALLSRVIAQRLGKPTTCRTTFCLPVIICWQRLVRLTRCGASASAQTIPSRYTFPRGATNHFMYE